MGTDGGLHEPESLSRAEEARLRPSLQGQWAVPEDQESPVLDPRCAQPPGQARLWAAFDRKPGALTRRGPSPGRGA